MIAAQNQAYMHMYAENLKMTGSLETFQYVFFWETNSLTLLSNRKVFDTIASGMKTSHDPLKEDIEEPDPLNVSDYPAVKFWYKDQRSGEERRKKYEEEHNIRRPKGRPSKENVRFWFLENEDGTTVARPIVNRLRAEAKAIWDKMSKKYSSMSLPWSSILPEQQLEFWIKLECEFPLLCLCAHHYKANTIATSDYTHWYKHRFPDTSSTSNSGTGLTASSSSGGTRKRRRSSKPIRSRKSTRRGTASRRVRQPSTDDENEEEEEEEEEEEADDDEYDNDDNDGNNNNNDGEDEDEDDDNDDDNDNNDKEEEEETVEKVIEPEINSDNEVDESLVPIAAFTEGATVSQLVNLRSLALHRRTNVHVVVKPSPNAIFVPHKERSTTNSVNLSPSTSSSSHTISKGQAKRTSMRPTAATTAR